MFLRRNTARHNALTSVMTSENTTGIVTIVTLDATDIRTSVFTTTRQSKISVKSSKPAPAGTTIFSTVITTIECEYLRFDYVEREWYCAFRLTRRDKLNYVCVCDDDDVKQLIADEIYCPCWRSLDDE